MGEIRLALQEGMGGLERLVVVKRIAQQFDDDDRFVHLLFDEARLAASIRHPNVVQMLDIGHDADGYFLVMEYLSGENLAFIRRTLDTRGERVPPAIACRLGAEIAAGLHCVHTACDAASRPQPIVHRDVTPSNLILCFNGAVKIVDFGVAKDTLGSGQTSAGVRGKISYMAPEQLRQQAVDGRTDVFQLGICLHELLTGQRLFDADGDRERAMAVMDRQIPLPSSIVPSLPASLDRVVLWALDRDASRRPATADEFRAALEAAAADCGAVSRHDLGAWMKATFAERLAERTEFEHRCVAEMRQSRSGSGGVRPERTVPLPAIGTGSMGTVDSKSARSPAPSVVPVPVPARSRHSMIVGIGAIAVLLMAGSAITWKKNGSQREAAPAAPVPLVPGVGARTAGAITTTHPPRPRDVVPRDVAITASPSQPRAEREQEGERAPAVRAPDRATRPARPKNSARERRTSRNKLTPRNPEVKLRSQEPLLTDNPDPWGDDPEGGR